MIMNGNGESFLGVILADALQIELPFDFGGLGNADPRFVFARLREFLIKHLLAEDDAIVADINTGAGDELFNFGVRLAAKTAQRDVGRAGHSGYSGLSTKLVARSTNPGISFRDWTTSSTRP